ncbi:MAG: hypothetical protein Q9P44_16920 [Anaerolineae bacterium]|nr:hypothetical protein [Anaerolineae bacterium]
MSKIKPEYIQLETGEDIPSVRDRLSFIRGKRVLIIWPETGTALSRKLDLVFMQRNAKRRVIQLALVTHDPQVIVHAKELGISTFETIKEAENSKWKRGRTRVFVQRHHKPKDEPDPEELMSVASRVRNPRKRMSDALRRVVQVAVAMVVFSAIGGAIFVAAPSAQINLTLAQEIVNIEALIIANPDPSVVDVDIDSGTIPATLLRATVQTVQSIETGGEATGEDSRAIGVVTFTNQTPRTIEIPANTQVTTSAGTPIRFTTTVTASLAGQVGARTDVAIEAIPEFSGSIGNVTEGLINTVIGSLSEQVTVRNLQPTTGGTSQTFAIVTQDDYDRLMGIVRAQLQARALEEMEANFSSDTQVIVVESVHIPESSLRRDWINYSHEVGAFSETLTLDMQAIVEALVIDDRFARQIVFARLSAEKPSNLVLQPDTFIYTRGAVLSTNLNGTTTFSASGNALATAQVDTFQIQQIVAGKSIEEAQTILNNLVGVAPDTTPEIEVSPSWLWQMPILPVRISIRQSGDL